MLLLLMNRHHLSELFKIKQGLAIQTKKKSSNQEGKYRYKVIYPSNLNEPFKTLNINDLTDCFTDKEITTDKLLTKEDYIVSCKGVIKGFPMLNSENAIKKVIESNYQGIIASNHFITLRPFPSTQKGLFSLDFMDNVLDLVVDKMSEFIKNSSGPNKKNHITIFEIGNISIEMLLALNEEKIKEFDRIYKDWKNCRDSFLKVETQLKDFNNTLVKQLKIKL